MVPSFLVKVVSALRLAGIFSMEMIIAHNPMPGRDYGRAIGLY